MVGVLRPDGGRAIIEWLRGSIDERTALAGYHERRDAHGLAPYHDTVRIAADVRPRGS